jgi:hypothetical protein
METQESPTLKQSLATVLGGIEEQVSHQNGQTETVKIRQLPFNLMLKYLQIQDDEPAMVELFCNKDKDWSLTLAPEDFKKVLNQGEEINADFFRGWLERRVKRRERVLPALKGDSLPPNSSLPTQPSNAA